MRHAIFIAAALATILAASPALAADDTTPAYFTGKDYRGLPESERTAYVAGASDMVSRMCELVDSGSVDFCNRMSRCADKWSPRELREFIDSYLSDGTKDDYGMASNYRAAMNTNCPQ